MVSRMGQGIRQVVGFGDRSTGGSNFGGECEVPIVTNEEFAVYVQPVRKRRSRCCLMLWVDWGQRIVY